jgi:Bacterial Ig domain
MILIFTQTLIPINMKNLVTTKAKKNILLFFLLCSFNFVFAQTKLIPAGSVIINMGSSAPTYANSLKPYGLVYNLMEIQHVPVVWSINPTKIKDGIDFTVDGQNFRGGTFIVEKKYVDIPSVATAINNFVSQGVIIHTTLTAVTVPVYKELFEFPNWVLDPVNGSIAQGYLTNAGIPSGAYRYSTPSGLTSCDDLFILTHADPTWATHGLPLLNWTAPVASGGTAGWLHTGCHSASMIENLGTPYPGATLRTNFLSVNGLWRYTNLVGPGFNNPVTGAVNPQHNNLNTPPFNVPLYPADAIMQYMNISGNAQGAGSEKIYLPTNGWRPTTKVPVFDANHPRMPTGLFPNQAASLVYGRAFGDPNRGMVMYQAGHDLDNGNESENVAAQRAFLNFSFDAPTGRAPIITNNTVAPLQINSGTSYTFNVSAISPRGSALSYAWSSTCGGSFATPTTLNTTFTAPLLTPGGSDADCLVSLVITDSCGRVSFYSYPIKIIAPPAPPVANNDSFVTYNTNSIMLTPLANDTDLDNDINPSSVTNLSSLTVAGGTFAINSFGTISFYPTPGFIGTATLTYSVCDLTPTVPLCDTAIITVTVLGSPCPAPQIVSSVPAYGSAITSSSSWSSTANALGAPNALGASATISGASLVIDFGAGNSPVVGTQIQFRIYSTTGVLVTGTIDASTTTTFPVAPVAVSTSALLAAPQTVTFTVTQANTRYIRVTGVNRFSLESVTYSRLICFTPSPPVANDDVVAAPLTEDDANGMVNVITNDTDPNGNPTAPLNGVGQFTVDLNTTLSGIQTSMTTAQGVWTLNSATGVVTFDPATNFSGTANLIYQLCDSTGLCDTAIITFTVNPVNDPPAANDDIVPTPLIEDGPDGTISILTNDTDPDGNPTAPLNGLGQFTVDINTLVAGIQTSVTNSQGVWTLNTSTGLVTFNPANNYFGLASLTYQLCDPSGLCDTAIITFTVSSVNDIPVANDDIVATPLMENGANGSVNIIINDTDGDGNPSAPLNGLGQFTVDLNTSVSGIQTVVTDAQGIWTLNTATGFVTFNPATNFYGTASLTYQLCDPTALCDTAVITFTVNPLARAALSGTNLTCNINATVSVQLIGSQPWSITYTNGSTPTTITGITASPYTFTVAPTTTTTYSLVSVSDVNGSGTVSGSAIVSRKVWNGSVNNRWEVANNWSPAGIPNQSDYVIIPVSSNNPIISGTDYKTFACKLLIRNNASLNILSSNTITVTNDVTVEASGNFQIENNASLIQIDNVSNSGNIEYKRTASVRKLDYVYWSSPVAGMNVSNLASPLSLGPIYKWNPTIANVNGGQGTWVAAASETMVNAKGYIARAPASFSSTTPQPLNASFTGTPNNGNIDYTISRGSDTNTSYHQGLNGIEITNYSDNWNLVGNPYPSAISASQFLLNNSSKIIGTVGIWTHGTLPLSTTPNPFYGSYGYNYTANDYIFFNFTGTTCCPLAPTDYYIGAGQGFFIQMKDGPTTSDVITFSNDVRNNNFSNATFYRTSEPETSVSNRSVRTIERNRIWLDVVNSNGQSSRTLFGYVQGATNGWDDLYDSYISLSGALAIYSVSDDKKHQIQGKKLPFEITDEVPVGMYAPTNGTYSIAIAAVDGIFNEKGVYLKDLLLNVTHNLKTSPYSFTTTAGSINDRFKVVYLSNSDNNKESSTNEVNDVIVSTNNAIEIKSLTNLIHHVTILDVLGIKVAEFENVSSNELIVDLEYKDRILLVKIQLQNGEEFTKKVKF